VNSFILFHLVGIALLLACSFFFSCTETTLFSLSGYKVRKIQRHNKRRGQLISRLLSNPRRLLISILIGNMFVNILSSSLGESLMRHLTDGAEGTIIAIFAMSFAILVAGEITPKTIAIQCNERLAPIVAPVINVIGGIQYPLRRVIRAVSDPIIAFFSRSMALSNPAITEEELKTAISIGSREGIVDSQEKEMIQGVFDFARMRVASIMRPRNEIVALEIHRPLPEVQEAVRKNNYSRLPIYEDDFDNVIGVLYSKDLLAALCGAPQVNVRSILRPAYVVPESKTARSLLAEFRRRKTHIAVVVDEYGSVSGIVTLEDILEKIVGEIRDRKEECPDFQQIDRDSFKVNARMELGRFNQLLGVGIKDRRSATIGGFVLNRAGKIPPPGYHFRYGRLSFTVSAADKNRVREIIVRRAIQPWS